MNLRQKLLLAALLLTIIPAIIISTMLGYYAITSSNESLEFEEQRRLIGLRNSQKDRVETYFDNLGKEVVVMSGNLMTINAMKEFTQSFGEYDPALDVSASSYSELQTYYRDEYMAQYRANNPDDFDVVSLYGELSPEARYYQQQYIANNPYPLGSKGLMDASEVQNNYSLIHGKYHTKFRQYIEAFGLYDVFLVEPITGNIVYSVNKEIDYATSLKYGPFKDTGLGRAFAAANNSNEGVIYFEDYSRFLPSYNAQEMFLSTPIMDNGVQIGVLVYQVPVSKVNAMLTFDQKWQEEGLGDSGESYLIGPDSLLRSDSRFRIENASEFTNALTTSGADSAMVNDIQRRNTAIGLFTVNTTPAQKALNNEDGFEHIVDYRGVPVLSAYTPVQVFDKTWGLLVEFDEEEAFQASAELTRTLLIIASIITLALIVLGVLAALRFVRTISKPITELDETIQKISEGDNDARVEVTTSDELGKLGEAVNSLMDDKLSGIQQKKENEQLNNSVINLLKALNKITDKDFTVNVPVTEDIIGTISASLNTLTAETSDVLKEVTGVSNQVVDVSGKVKETSDEVILAATEERKQILNTVNSLDAASAQMNKIAKEAQNANELAATTIDKTKLALQTVHDSNEGINSIRETIFETEKRIKRLGDRSQEISGIVKLINNIAERTHILALNASMHAASAGEAGRGFAVVADEVQRLAENAKDSTAEISTLVNTIRAETTDTVNAMNNVISQVAKGTELAENAGVAMNETNNTTASLVSLVQMISEQAMDQVKASNELKSMAKSIEAISEKTEVSLNEQKQSTDVLVEYSNSLKDSVGVFKLPE